MSHACLIIPPSAFLLDERVFVSLGILRVAAALERAGRDVEVLDLSGVENYEEVVASHAASSDPAWWGVTATTPQMPAANRILRSIKAAKPEARVVLGGPHPTLVNASYKYEQSKGKTSGRGFAARWNVLTDGWAGMVCGDGEDAALRIPGELSHGRPFVVDADDPKGTLFLTKHRYEELPRPARHLVDMSSYRYTIDGHNATSLIAQLGCPFNCGFCGGRKSSMLRRIRTRSTESIVEELRHVHETYGHTGFMFYDDELNVNKEIVSLMRAIRDLQDELGVEFRLRGFVKSELFNDEQAEALAAAGFRWLLCGFESGSPRILENINKKATREDNSRMLETAHRHGLKVKALMSVGHPGESEETCHETLDWLLNDKPDDFDCTIITTYPGTPYYDEAEETEEGVWTYTYEKTGDQLHARELDYNAEADYYKGNPDGGYKSYVWTDHLSSERLVELRDTIERTVREKLSIPFNPGRPGMRFEMSPGSSLPPNVLRRSA